MSQLQETFWAKGQADPNSQDPSGLSQGSNKRVSELWAIAVGSNNKTQYSSADHTPLPYKSN